MFRKINGSVSLALSIVILLGPLVVGTISCNDDDDGYYVQHCGRVDADDNRLIRDPNTDECVCNTDAGHKSFYNGKLCISVEELDRHSWKVITFTDPIPFLPYEQLMLGGPSLSNGASQNGNIFVPFPGEFGIPVDDRKGDATYQEWPTSVIVPDYCIGHPNYSRELEYYFLGGSKGFMVEPYSHALEQADFFRFSANFTDIDGDCRAEWSKATGFIRNDTMYGELTVRQFTANGGLTREPVDTFAFVGVPYDPPYPPVN